MLLERRRRQTEALAREAGRSAKGAQPSQRSQRQIVAAAGGAIEQAVRMSHGDVTAAADLGGAVQPAREVVAERLLMGLNSRITIVPSVW